MPFRLKNKLGVIKVSKTEELARFDHTRIDSQKSSVLPFRGFPLQNGQVSLQDFSGGLYLFSHAR